MIKTLVTLFLISLSSLSNAQTATSKAILDTSTEAVDQQVLASSDRRFIEVTATKNSATIKPVISGLGKGIK
jgi:hypothetical protein